jgi:ubiquinone/menaquinone biosynthesis C-methylase UbiE
MRLNRFEKLLMNNPVRPWFQRLLETRRLLRLGGKTTGHSSLEIGCGRGVGVQIILEDFGSKRVHAFDLDADMVRLARRHLARQPRVVLWTGDSTAIAVKSNTYDSVFDFGAIHHVLNWRDTLAEIHRVLKPGGRFFAEEVPSGLITHPLVRRILDHPQQDRFGQHDFNAALEEIGFTIAATDRFLNVWIWTVAVK